MILAGHQPNYLPWIGFFHKMKCSDIFVILDDVQYIKNSFINRTRILGVNGLINLTVPVNFHSRQKITEVAISEKFSPKNHLESIRHAYGKTPNYPLFKANLHSIYNNNFSKLFELNMELIFLIRNILGISSKIVYKSDKRILGRKSEMLINLCKEYGADTYLSGQGAKKYIDEELFTKNKIKVIFHDFYHPEYPQRGKEFVAGLSIIDFICNYKEFKDVFHQI